MIYVPVHLFEFEDLKWFPSFLRNYGTDFLQFFSNTAKIYQPVIPIIEKGLQATSANTIIDLASGGGGGLIWLNNELRKKDPDVKIILTDYFPNIPAFEYTSKEADNFEFIRKSVDARNVPPYLNGLRTNFYRYTISNLLTQN